MRRKALVSILELLKPALADQSVVPIYMNYCFTGKTVYATNGNLGIIGPCTIDTEPFSCVGDTMLGLLRACRVEDVQIEFDKENNEILILAGKTKMRLAYLGGEEFLFEEPEDEPWDVVLDLDDRLMNGIEISLTTSTRDNAQPALMGITLDTGDGISLYSSDGEAITHFLIDGANYGKEATYVIPNEFMESVLRIARRDKSVNGKLFASEDWAMAEIEGDYRVYGRILHPEDPLDFVGQIEQHMGTEEPPWVKTPRGLEHALDRARVVAEPVSKPTSVKVTDGKMKLFTSTDMGEVRDVLNIAGDHPDAEANVNAALMARSLAVCSELAVLQECTCYRQEEDLFQILSNIGE